MSYVFGTVLAIVLVLMLPYAVRVVRGPTLFDRIIALNAIGSSVPVALVIVGLMYARVDMFVDIALALFLLNLFMTLLIAKYVREKGGAER
jgi:multicomponent Na+:H+ antiporter subunit F